MKQARIIKIIANMGMSGEHYGIKYGDQFPVYEPTEAEYDKMPDNRRNASGCFIMSPFKDIVYLASHEFAYVGLPVMTNSKELKEWFLERTAKGHAITFIRGHNGYEDNITVCAVCEATDEYFEYDWQLPINN